MPTTATISAINKTLKLYFDKHNEVTNVFAKDLMPQFIAAGIFPTDQKNGLPIREILRQLDKEGQLHLIRYVLPERKMKNTSWFFTPINGKALRTEAEPKRKTGIIKSENRQSSDESYVIDLCDEILGVIGICQYKFDFLLGDKGITGSQRRLPVDAFYPSLKLVVEYREVQHSKPISHFDKPYLKTISGVHRGEQRRIYDQRRRDVLPKHGLRLVEIQYEQLKHDNRGRLLRDKDYDKKALKKLLLN